jgi:copper chaperone CopZ
MDHPRPHPAWGAYETGVEETIMELTIEGMTCQHCSAAVKKALEGVDGVAEAHVDLAAGATITGSAPIPALVQAVEAEGYRAAPAPS